jgi:hypothetical protein
LSAHSPVLQTAHLPMQWLFGPGSREDRGRAGRPARLAATDGGKAAQNDQICVTQLEIINQPAAAQIGGSRTCLTVERLRCAITWPLS